MSLIDLHIHSNFSDDGQYSPAELIDKCLQAGIKYISIADHNSVKGIPKAITAARWKDLEVIPAIELDCLIGQKNLHLLGYGINYTNPLFTKVEDDILNQDRLASTTRMSLIRDLGIEFDDKVIESLSVNGIVNGEMIAEAAMTYDVDHKNPLLQPYYEGGERSDNPNANFYWDYCHQGKPGYVEVKFISIDEAVKLIKDNGGVPVLAHPGIIVGEDLDLLQNIVSSGVQGIEVYSSYHSNEQVEYYKKFALEQKVLQTCGSDFHGKNKPNIYLGATGCEEQEEEIITFIKKRIKNNRKNNYKQA
ncbi:MAG: PHP domain-containing protein [Anaerolineaceae bacterium]|nr:PHP domain-containing protein [Anaerolineaceae bacterium]